MAKIQTDISRLFAKVCSACKSTKTAFDRKGREIWVKDTCKKCYNKIIHAKFNPLRVRTKRSKDRKVFNCSMLPRKGECDYCHRRVDEGKISRTFIWIQNPDTFDPSKPSQGTEELCFRHMLEFHPYVIDKQRFSLTEQL